MTGGEPPPHREPRRERIGDRPPSPIMFVPSLLLAAPAFAAARDGVWRPGWPATTGLAAFVALYLVALHIGVRDLQDARLRARSALLVTLAAVAFALDIGYGGAMARLFPVLAVAASALLPWRGRWPPPAVVAASVPAVGLLYWWRSGADATGVAAFCVEVFLSGLAAAVTLQLFRIIAQLRHAREELARVAISQERERFARDLHDLLGHSLTAMVLKAEAIRRLARRDPELAQAQAAEIEEIGRDAVREVRRVVGDYRGAGLANEIDNARRTADDVGLTLTVRQSGPPLPQPIDVLLGWVVREGVTNVVRHSGARRCWIEIEHRPATVRLELRDDGVGAPPPVTDALAPDAGANSGHGLTGLRERVHAAGGELESGALRGRRGFGLVVCLPVETTTPDDRTGVPA